MIDGPRDTTRDGQERTPEQERRRRRGLLYVATLGNFLAAGLFFAAIPLYVSQELDGSNAQVGLAVGSFSISAILLRPWIGRSVDRRGRRPFLLVALVLWMLSALAFFVAWAVPTVVVIRLVQGFAGGCFYTTAASMATDLAPQEQRASAIARFSLFLYAGFAIGPAIGEQVISASGFPAAWLTAVGLAGMGLVAALLLPETGTSTIAARAEHAEGISVRRFLHPAAIGPGLVLACAGVGYSSITFFSPIYAREIGLSSSGAMYATFAVTIIVVRLLSLRFVDRVGRAAIALPGLALASFGLAVLALFPEPVAAFPGVACFGAGFALVFPALMAFTVDRVPDHERGEALGSFTAFMDLGTGLGGYLVGSVADAAGFQWGYATPAVLCLVAFAILWVISRRPMEVVVDTSTMPWPDPEG